jgi:acetylxylan esterase
MPFPRSIYAAAVALLLLLPVVVLSAELPLQQVTEDFGPNPSNAGFFIYVPTKLQVNPPIVVDSHPCHNTAQDAFTETQLATLADTYGYIVIYPNSPNDADMCWDVSSNETLTHDGGGDSLGIVSMVQWTLAKYGGNPDRVFSVSRTLDSTDETAIDIWLVRS